MTSLWKQNWDEAKANHEAWWRGKGMVLASWGTGIPSDSLAREGIEVPEAPSSLKQWHTDPEYVARRIEADMARKEWPADMVPLCWPDLGTVSLAPYLGAKSNYGTNNVWYDHTLDEVDPGQKLRFDPQRPAVQELETTVQAVVQRAQGRYLVGMPALVPNLDVLAEVRGTQNLLIDMLEEPEWVHDMNAQIDEAWKPAFDRMRELIALADGSMAFGYFMLWGKGRTSLLQCDVSAMFSPDMFEEFVIPGLKRECAFLDHSLYHVDGHQCLAHVDHILALEDLDAVEWTPDPQVPGGGDPHWFPLYRKIRDAGKSLWVANCKPQQVKPLLDAIGGKGLYLTVDVQDVGEMEQMIRLSEPYRR